MTNYKIFFHLGGELGLKTKVAKGTATLDESRLLIQGVGGLSVRFQDISAITLFRLHGLGRVLQVDYAGGRLFLSVVRLMIGQFALINFFKTGELHNRLAAVSNKVVS